MKLSQIAIDDVIPGFPKWSEAQQNPMSAARVIAHSLYRQLDYVHNYYDKASDNMFLQELNPLEEPFRNWVTLADDIVLSGVVPSGLTREEVMNEFGTADIYGVISGEIITLDIKENTRSYLYSPPNDYFVEYKIPVSGTCNLISGVIDASGYNYDVVSGDPYTYAYLAERASIVDGDAYIMLNNMTSGEPAGIKADIPSSFLYGEMDEPYICSGNAQIEVTGEILSPGVLLASGLWISSGDSVPMVEFDDELILESTIQVTVKKIGNKVLLPYFAIGSITVADAYDSERSVTYSLSTTQGVYNTDKYNHHYDFDGNGIIDELDYNKIQLNVGQAYGNHSPTNWRKYYGKYDLDKDGTVSSKDLKIFNICLNSARNEGTIITFQTAGIFNITYKYTQKGGTSYIYDTDMGPAYLDTKAYNNIESNKSESWVAAAYSNLFKSYLYLDEDQNRITVVKYDPDVPTLVIDKFDILLPIGADEIPVSMDIYKSRLYVLINDEGNSEHYFLMFDLTENIHELYTTLYVHGRKQTDESIIRDKQGLVAPIGFDVISDDIIVAIDKIGNGFLNIKLLRGIHDCVTTDDMKPENLAAIFTREKYDKVVNGEHELPQFYFSIWNRFDDYAFECGFDRLPGENNIKLKDRIDDYLSNFPDPSRASIEKEIDREFDL